jgi:hypothetical protein
MKDGCEEREFFSKKMVDILNYGALNLATGIGYRVGLYEIIDTFDGPQTLSIIAGKAGLSSRLPLRLSALKLCHLFVFDNSCPHMHMSH